MISGLDLNAVTEFTLPNDVDNPSVFMLSVLPSDVFGQLMENSENISQMEMLYRIVSFSLKGWKNFNVPFKQEESTSFGRKINIVPMDILSCIDTKTITSLAKRCMEINKISEDERKN